MSRPPALSVVSVLMLVTALATVLFWLVFFADLAAQQHGVLAGRSDAWYAWELSFPLADAWMAATAFLGAVGLWRQRAFGLLWGLVSGGAMVFLGLMDVLFFLLEGLYLPLTVDTVLELFIHVWVTGFGLLAIFLIWRFRATLCRR